MKKIQIILILLAISLFFSSCARRFSPMYYYNKKASSSNSESDSTPSDIAGDEDIPPDQDPFKNGQWNDIGYQFDGNKISEFLFGASFDGNNVPIYKFYKKDAKTWELKDTLTSEYYFNGSDDGNKAQTYNINPANFYRYNYKNPLVDPTAGYNQSTRMERFLFYRLQGKAVVVSLNNYLIAVDTHSKLVFAYAKITKTGEAVGQKYPTEFEAVELHGEKRKFYEYDPIGFMSYDESKDSLTLTLYEEYKNEMAKDANAYFPQVHDASRSVAGYDNASSAGRSPYYMVAIEDIDPQTIMEQLKGKTYGIRDKLTLYTYKFSSNGLTLTLTIDHYYDGKIEKSYNCSKEVVGATSLKYGDVTITGLGTYDKIKDDNREYILDYKDNGPDFIYRVAGKIFKNANAGRTYEFSADGMSFKYTENGKTTTYSFVEQSSPSESKAAYSKSGNVFWGLKLSEYNGKKDGRISGGTESVNLNPGTAMIGDLNDYEAFIDDSSIPSEFVTTVSGKTYFYRDYTQPDSGNGNSLNAYKYIFNKDATQLTYVEMVYKQEDVSTTYKLDNVSGIQATYTSNDKTLVIKLGVNPNMIYNGEGSALADSTATDKGPFFLDMVRGNEYIAEDNSYKYSFSSDGKLLTFTYASGESTQYDYTQVGTEYFKAAYKQQNTWFPRYWALRVTGEGNTLEMSTGSLAYPTDIIRDATYGWKAILGGGMLIKDNFLNAVASKVFEIRNTSDTTKLDRYTFSSGGASIVYEQIDWYTDQVIESSKIEFYGYEKIDDAKGKYKYNNTAGQIITVEFSIDSLSPTTLSKDNIVSGYYNYKDPGPYIYDVVKGKKFICANGNTLQFGSDGKTITQYNADPEVGLSKNETYTFKKVKDGEHTASTYWEDNAWGFGYWKFVVEDKGKTVKQSTGAWADANSSINTSVLGEPYILQE